MTIMRLFEWLGLTPLGVFMKESSYAFPAVKIVHLLALACLGGAILIINLRSFGLGIKIASAECLARELQPYLIGSLVISMISGLLLLSAEPMKCYYNLAFRLKMLCLAAAILFYFAVQTRVFQFERERRHTFLQKLSAAISLLLWFSVGLAGRAIGVV